MNNRTFVFTFQISTFPGRMRAYLAFLLGLVLLLTPAAKAGGKFLKIFSNLASKIYFEDDIDSDDDGIADIEDDDDDNDGIEDSGDFQLSKFCLPIKF